MAAARVLLLVAPALADLCEPYCSQWSGPCFKGQCAGCDECADEAEDAVKTGRTTDAGDKICVIWNDGGPKPWGCSLTLDWWCYTHTKAKRIDGGSLAMMLPAGLFCCVPNLSGGGYHMTGNAGCPGAPPPASPSVPPPPPSPPPPPPPEPMPPGPQPPPPPPAS
eukprot:3903855-Prymnesium_polylepis.1